MIAYQHFASMYDKFMEHAPYDEWVQLTEQIIQQEKIEVKNMIDLGCGTGEITIRLAQLGYPIIGVDYSANMLAFATEKATARKARVNWIQQDIRKLTGFSNVDLIISYCDVINYITEINDLEAVFMNVHQSLAPDGFFIFDIHNLHYAQAQLMNQTFADVTDELAYIWNCEKGDQDGEMFHYLTFFQKEREKYLRFDEIHHQQTYDMSTYEKLLKKCGFSKIQFFSDFLVDNSFSVKNSERIFIIAKK